jgi:hypothetical protein
MIDEGACGAIGGMKCGERIKFLDHTDNYQLHKGNMKSSEVGCALL